MKPNSQNHPELISTLLAFHKSSTDGKMMHLDPNNKTHIGAIKAGLEAAGRTKEDYPNLFKALNNPSSHKEGEASDTVDMVDAGKTASGKAIATIWSTTNIPTTIKGGATFVFDHHSGKLLAKGDRMTVQEGFVASTTKSSEAEDAGDKIDVLHLGHATNPDGSTRFYSFAKSAIPTSSALVATETTASDCGIGAASVSSPCPVYSPANPEIEIAVGRSSASQGTNDYVYIEPSGQGQGGSPNLIVPFVGHTGLSGVIDFANITIDNFDTRVYVQYNGATQITERYIGGTQTDQKFLDSITQGSASNMLQWNFPFDGLGQGNKGYANSDSVVYQAITLNLAAQSNFYFAFNNIPLVETNPAPPFFVCSTDTPGESSLNCTTVLNISYTFHCVAAGTMITLEDGSELPVEKVNDHCRVLSTDGASYAVTATVQGNHSSDDLDKIFRITTANQQEVVATGEHMLFTNKRGVTKVRHLAVGMEVITADGPSQVKSIEMIDHSGLFVGLIIGNPDEKAKDTFPENFAGYYSGGILSADQNSHKYNSKMQRLDTNFALKHIDEALHTDYTSAVRHIRE